MAQTVSILLCGDDRTRLEAMVADRNRRHKHVQRAQIVLLSAARQSVAAIAQAVGVSRPSVWRWQQRFAEDGVAGLLKDRSRPPGKPRLPEEVALKVVALTCSEPPGEVTHWTGRDMAKAAGISHGSVRRIWAKYDLQPHRIKTFKRSNAERCGSPAFSLR
jgi:transposase